MSVDSAKISCTGCSYQVYEHFQPIHLHYVPTASDEPAQQDVIQSHCTTGWCYQCDGYRYIEDINPTQWQAQLRTIQQQQSAVTVELTQRQTGFLQRWWTRSRQRELREQAATLTADNARFNQLLLFFQARQSPARCLQCFSNQTAPISFDGEHRSSSNFVHRCGGRLQISFADFELRCLFRPKTYLLNKEGEQLRCE